MTKQDFLDGFYIKYDEITDLAAPGWTPLELSKIASNEQEALTVLKYGPRSNKLGEGFEETEKRIQDLGELVRYKSYTTFTAGFFDNSVEILLPNTQITVGPTDYSDVYWFTIYEDTLSDILDCTKPNNTTIYVAPKISDIIHGELKVALKDPFRQPYIKGNDGKVLRIRSEGRKHILITDGTFNITKYNIGYIRKPIPIDLTASLTSQVSELSDHVHRELLDRTVEFCFKATKQDKELGIELQLPKE